MPPSSRGEGTRLHSNGLRQDQAQRGRRRFGQARTLDPLSHLFVLATYPILALALILLHVLYYIALRLQATWRFQQVLVAQIQHDQGTFADRLGRQWRRKGRHGNILLSACEEAAEDRLANVGSQRRGEGIGSGDHSREDQQHEQNDALKILKAKVAGNRLQAQPKHIALVIGPRPIRTRHLLWRYLKRRVQWSALSIARSNEEEKDFDHARQRHFALENAKAAFRLCGLAGVDTLTLFDTQGILRSFFAQHENAPALLTDDGRVHPSNGARGASLDSPNDTDAAPSGRKITADISLPLSDAQNTANSANGHADGHPAKHVIVKVHVMGPEQTQGALAQTANALNKRLASNGKRTIEVSSIQKVLADRGYPTEPDLLIIHGGPRQVSTLHGCPPWLVRLCEIYHDVDAAPDQPLTAISFEKALEAYARSEQRYGR